MSRSKCLERCVAYILRLPPSQVPSFNRTRWRKDFEHFLWSKDRFAERWTFKQAKRLMEICRYTEFIVSGPRKHNSKVDHAVVYRGTKPVFDPYTGGGGKLHKRRYVWIVY